MATITLTFTATAAKITISGAGGSSRGEHSTPLGDGADPVVRAVEKEFEANGTTSGTVVITAS